MSIRVGAQTVTWGESIKDNMEHIVRFLASLGYEGVETGMRHFYPERANEYRALYRSAGMTPIAVHSGGKFWDPAQSSAEKSAVNATITFASKVGFRYLIVSGNPEETPDSMKGSASVYSELADRCADAGIRLCYHNHDWEMENGGVLLDILVEETGPEVGLVLDIAWAHVAGFAPIDAIRRYRSRVAYLHLKDVAEREFCELGTGEIDFSPILKEVERSELGWLVVEQDTTSNTPELSLTTNMKFLRNQRVIST